MNNCRPTGVQVDISLRLVVPDASALPVQASLVYRTTDPYAVHIVFHAGIDDPTGDVSWSFSRELMTEGLYRQTGFGDVKLWPWAGRSKEALGLALSSPDGYALFEMPRAVVEQFLTRSYALIAAGAEPRFLDLDAALATLLHTPDADAR